MEWNSYYINIAPYQTQLRTRWYKIKNIRAGQISDYDKVILNSSSDQSVMFKNCYFWKNLLSLDEVEGKPVSLCTSELVSVESSLLWVFDVLCDSVDDDDSCFHARMKSGIHTSASTFPASCYQTRPYW